MTLFGNNEIKRPKVAVSRRNGAQFLKSGNLYHEILKPMHEAAENEPFVLAQIGQSLDGRVATVSGDAGNIGGTAGLDHLHHLRAQSDVVVVGAGTVAADNPRLTVRRVAGKNPARAVIDPNGRLADGLHWSAGDGVKRILITANGAAHSCDSVIRLPLGSCGINPKAIVSHLFAEGLRIILIEGGPATISKFLEADCLDRLHICVSPLIIGSGTIGLNTSPISSLQDAIRPTTRTFDFGGGEVLFDCDMRS